MDLESYRNLIPNLESEVSTEIFPPLGPMRSLEEILLVFLERATKCVTLKLCSLVFHSRYAAL